MAYPILYKANETNFEHLGVSVLSDASKCYVSREKNGIYILEFDYPVNGKDVDKIKEGMYIKSDAGYRTKNQRFVISKITKTQNEFKIYCQHISQVKTTMNAIRPDITVTSVSAEGALRAWRDNLLDSREEFFVQSDISTLNSTTWKVENIENARDALGGKAGSILDVWGGEYEFDNLNITLHRSMGIDNPTIIAYGKNLLDLEQEQSILETYTSVFPFKKYTDDNNREQLITLPEILLDSIYLNKFTHRRILKVDFSSDENLKTVEQLRSKAKSYIKSNNVGVPKTNLKINYQDLSKVEGIFDNPALEQIDLCDRLKVYYNELGILNENAKVVKVIWDVILEENHEIEVGDGRSSFTDSTSAKLETLQAQNDSVLARINALIAEQDAAFDRYFNEKSKIIEDKVKSGYEEALLSSEEKLRKMGEAFDEKVNQFREQVSTTVENYNRQFQSTNLEISKNRVEATKQIQALTDRVNNIQDISNNETVRELRGLVNGATSKVTELENSITREFTAVKKKNEDGLNAVKAEFTKGVDGLTSKISSLEDYKNQDGTRTESLKQWVQRDTASQLSRERTEINKIIDSKGYIKNTEFSSKFTESARGITNQLSALENYKNQDGVRVANMQIWAQNNTANQLTAERRNIEKWVNDKGYATNSVVENKVQETANSFSREISNVRNSIPTSVGGRNRALRTTKDWGDFISGESGIGSNLRIPLHVVLADGLKAGDKLLVSMEYSIDDVVRFGNSNITANFQAFADITQWDGRGTPFNQNIGTLQVGQNYRIARFEVEITSEMVKNNYWNLEIRVDGARSCKAHTKKCKIEVGNIYTDWTPAPEDVEQNVNELNSWKQTTTQTLNTVSSTLNDTVRHSQLRIGADGIDFGSNKVFNGRNLASLLSVSPDSIKAITDRVIITPSNENLVSVQSRDSVSFSSRDTWITPEITSDKLNNGDQFIIEGIGTWSGPLRHDFNFNIAVKYKSGNWTWISSRLKARGEYSNSLIPLKTILTINGLDEEVAMYRLGLHQPDWSNFTTITFKNAKIYKKKSAELIVDGSIEGRHVKANTLETGHHKAGSITSDIIAANAVKVGNLLVDDAMIQEFVAHKAFITKLWAQDAFIRSLKTVKITSTQIDTETLRGVTIEGAKFLVGRSGILDSQGNNLRISAPHDWGGSSGVGMQLRGKTEGEFNQGLNIYRVNDVRNPNTPLYTPDETALTVFGEIRGAFKINTMPKSGSLKSRMGVAVMTNVSKNTPIPPVGYRGASLFSVRSIFLRSGGGPTQIWVNDGTGSDSTYGVNVANMESDIKLKENISISNHSGLDVINKFKFHSFDWKADKFGYRKPHTKIGLIAQEVQVIQEDLVYQNPNALALDEFRLLNIALKAIQELSTQNKKLQQKIIKLEEKING